MNEHLESRNRTRSAISLVGLTITLWTAGFTAFAQSAILPARSASIPTEIQIAQSSEAIATFKRGEILYNAGQYKEALVEFDRTVQQDPKFATAWRLRASTLAQLKNYSDAMTSISKAVGSAPRDPDVWATQGDLYRDQGDYTSAITSYKVALRFMPRERQRDRTEVALSLSFSVFALGYQAAIANEQAVATQQYEAAVSAYDDAISEAQGGDKDLLSQSWLRRGEVLRRLKRYDEALSSFKQAVQLNSNLAEGWFRCGFALQLLGRDREAVGAYDKAVNLDSNYAEAWNNRGFSLYNQKKLSEAIQSFNRAIGGEVRNNWGGETPFDRARPWYGIADALFLQGCYTKAEIAYQQALKLNPKFEEAQKRSQELKRYLGQPSNSVCQNY